MLDKKIELLTNDFDMSSQLLRYKKELVVSKKKLLEISDWASSLQENLGAKDVTLVDREEALVQAQGQVSEKDKLIQKLSDQIQEVSIWGKELEQAKEVLVVKVAEQMKLIEAKDVTLVDREEALVQAQGQVSEKDKLIQKLSDQIQEVSIWGKELEQAKEVLVVKVAEQMKLIEAKDVTLVDREEALVQAQGQVSEKDKLIQKLSDQIEEVSVWGKELEQAKEVLVVKVAEQMKLIEAKDVTLVDREEALVQAQGQVSEKDKLIQKLSDQIEEVSVWGKELEQAKEVLVVKVAEQMKLIEAKDVTLVEKQLLLDDQAALIKKMNKDIHEVSEWATKINNEKVLLTEKLANQLVNKIKIKIIYILRFIKFTLFLLPRSIKLLFSIDSQKLSKAFELIRRGSFAQLRQKIEEKVYNKNIMINSNFEESVDSLTNYQVMYLFPVIDWAFRIQRPQQLSKGFQNNGYQVIYFSTTFAIENIPGFTYQRLENGVILVTLFLNEQKNIYTEKLSSGNIEFLLKSISELERIFQINNRVSIIDHPFWIELANKLSGKFTIYDCMDYHAGFGDESSYLAALEEKSMTECDLLLLTSEDLYSRFSEKNKNTALVRNGCEYSYFNMLPNEIKSYKKGKTIGYYGAISSWFDAEIVAQLAGRLTDYEFVLVGSTYGCENLHLLENSKNVTLVGEVNYDELTNYLYAFDVAIMPFKINELTTATNPVKIYEYLSAGKPVVSTKLPEVELMKEVVYLATSVDDFEKEILRACTEDNKKLQNKRMKFAKNNDWTSRFNAITEAISISSKTEPMVSIVVVTYNNLEITKACLDSMEKFNNYTNSEIIIVDNLSTDGTREYLTSYAKKHNNVTAVLHSENSGFAAGNNIGIKQSKGEYVVLLNNDTYVTPNWIKNLIKHFEVDNKIGMVGPRTNNIGNEARLDINYANMSEMLEHSYKIYYDNTGKQYNIEVLAFFCVAIKRDVINKVGLLDEIFGIGMFEDDDYCIKTRNAGYKLICADDVFIHHHLGASFNKDPEWKEKLFQKNKAIFEDRYGKWVPHEYRSIKL